MEASIAIIRLDPGSETLAQPGTPRLQSNGRSCSNTPLAAPWANNGPITSVRLEGGFRGPQGGLQILAEGLISVEEAMLVAEATAEPEYFDRRTG